MLFGTSPSPQPVGSQSLGEAMRTCGVYSTHSRAVGVKSCVPHQAERAFQGSIYGIFTFSLMRTFHRWQLIICSRQAPPPPLPPCKGFSAYVWHPEASLLQLDVPCGKCSPLKVTAEVGMEHAGILYIETSPMPSPPCHRHHAQHSLYNPIKYNHLWKHIPRGWAVRHY